MKLKIICKTFMDHKVLLYFIESTSSSVNSISLTGTSVARCKAYWNVHWLVIEVAIERNIVLCAVLVLVSKCKIGDLSISYGRMTERGEVRKMEGTKRPGVLAAAARSTRKEVVRVNAAAAPSCRERALAVEARTSQALI